MVNQCHFNSNSIKFCNFYSLARHSLKSAETEKSKEKIENSSILIRKNSKLVGAPENILCSGELLAISGRSSRIKLQAKLKWRVGNQQFTMLYDVGSLEGNYPNIGTESMLERLFTLIRTVFLHNLLLRTTIFHLSSKM